ncbi:hypothetical protein KO525_03995 [Psychrosphaera sp. B3R10]|uniref:hypothetical protein n=1 Tax=unclassified Psychrosphaera TaxID=2641570 RepID=UPI001C0A4778|nr:MULTISPECIES: hypothetical protein [unclassified Psychrosphaera]MBU2883079.1 hypothetical protein [Psychrosphaera sp. I2R16]MBU2988536.1 hypothetical protein [Psychrosphaera sp. B3R10]
MNGVLFRISSVIAVVYAVSMLLACSPERHSNHQSSASESPQDYQFVPSADKALMFIGQDSESIADYIKDVPEDNIEGLTLYTQLKAADPEKTLMGVHKTDNWLAGDTNFNESLALVDPHASLALGLSFDHCNKAESQNSHEQNIVEGKYDKTISHMIKHFKSLAPRKVYLRIGYEFDGPWNCYTPDNYKKTFRRIASVIAQQNALNITTFWQTAAWSDSFGIDIYDITRENHFDAWYPGDDVVDWVGLSVFYRDLKQWNYQPRTTPVIAQQKLVDFARTHNKPVMIAESAPQGYRIGGLTKSVIHENLPEDVTAEEIWQGWFKPYFDFIDENRDVIKAAAYINAHWETQGMWVCKPGIAAGQPGCSNGQWGDTRVQANALIKQRWLEQINDETRWVQTSQFEGK